MMQHKHLHYLLLGLILIEVLLTAYLVYEGSSALCIAGSDCASVQSSAYGTLFGVKLTVFGFVMFTLLLLLFLVTERYPQASTLFLYSTGAGALLAIYFISLQFFVLQKICSSCLMIDILSIIIFITTLFWYKSLRRMD